MRKMGVFVFVFLMCGSFAFAADGKRPDMQEHKRVVEQEALEIINGDMVIKTSTEASRLGILEGAEKKSGKKLWEKKIYTSTKDKDGQNIAIVAMEMQGGRLAILNSNNQRFMLDVSSKDLNVEEVALPTAKK